MDDSARRGRIGDLGLALAVLAVAGLVWREAARLEPAPFDPLGPRTLPIWICMGLVGLALLMLARLALGAAIGASRTSLITGLGQTDAAAPAPQRRPVLALATLALSIAYAVALATPPIRFVYATAVFIAALILTLGPRRPRDIGLAALVGAVGAGLVDLLFRVVFTVDLR